MLLRMDMEGNIINLKDTASEHISVCFYEHVATYECLGLFITALLCHCFHRMVLSMC